MRRATGRVVLAVCVLLLCSWGAHADEVVPAPEGGAPVQPEGGAPVQQEGGTPAQQEGRAPAPADGLRIAVAPFEVRLPEDDEVEDWAPNVAALLASELAERPGTLIVAPKVLGPEIGDPLEAGSVRRLARKEGVESVVVGTQRLDDDGLELDVELRSGHSGATIARLRRRAGEREELDAEVDSIAQALLDELGWELPAPPIPDGGAAEGGGSDLGLGLNTDDDPIRIRSEELEMIDDEAGRQIVFTRDVVVTQADITLYTDQLTAFYPPGASQPERLVAKGNVRVTQEDKRARCDRATYERTTKTVICVGRAEIAQGCDRVRGKEIHFDLERERVRVLGAPSVVIQPDDAADAQCVEDLS